MSQGPGKAKRGIPSKEENFNEWYPFIVEAAELVDKRYPIKGMDVWRPYGWKTMKLIDALTHEEMERTDHEEVISHSSSPNIYWIEKMHLLHD